MNEMHHTLSPGTILDGRYRLDAVLGQGGFGITYSAENIRVNLRVAIKELFWKDHSSRNAAVSPEVILENQQDFRAFETQKARFLQEARMIRDFSGQPGIARILDYFEANNTAYIVMEYVEGETLTARLARDGKMQAEDAFRLFLPLIESLRVIHQSGVIHRDISPDNIMVQPDGSLKLIDFGAARRYLTEGEKKVTAIAKDSYAPSEQYNQKGHQGPWTDVYSICATLYTCVTQVPPMDAVQRMFLDELARPSELGAEISDAYESVLMKGLRMDAGKRWQNMEELAEAIQAALPAVPADQPPRRHVLSWIILAAAAMMLAVFGIWAFRQYRTAHKFSGIRTVETLFSAPAAMTAREFGEAQEFLKGKVEALAGKDNYILRVDGASIYLTLPLSVLNGQAMDTVLSGEDWNLNTDHTLHYHAETVCNWEDPAVSLLPGKNQVRAENLKSRTGLFVFAPSEKLTRGQQANAMIDFKTRLDALGLPYSFGTVYGHEEFLAFRMETSRMGGFITSSIGHNHFRICGEISLYPYINADNYLSIERNEDGTWTLVYNPGQSHMDYFTTQLQEFAAYGQQTLFLEESARHHAIAEASLDQALEDGKITFSTLRANGSVPFTDEYLWVADYIIAVAMDTDLPASFNFYSCDAINEDGHTDFNGFSEDEVGLSVPPRKAENEMKNKVQAYAEENGYLFWQTADYDILCLQLEPDKTLFDHADAAFRDLIEKLDLSRAMLNRPLFVLLFEEEGEETCQVFFRTTYDREKQMYYNMARSYMGGSDRTRALHEEFSSWWKHLPLEEYGIVHKEVTLW